MKKSKFSEAQIAFILQQADEGSEVAEVCGKAGISDAEFRAVCLNAHWFLTLDDARSKMEDWR